MSTSKVPKARVDVVRCGQCRRWISVEGPVNGGKGGSGGANALETARVDDTQEARSGAFEV